MANISYSLLNYFSTDLLFAYLLVLVRMGSAMMFLPGMAEGYIPQRIKILFVVFLTLVIGPVLESKLPGLPKVPSQMFLLIGSEFFIGAFLGLLARLIYMSLEVAGMIISFQMSLGNATIFNPAMATQGSLVSVFLMTTGMLIIFATNLHHLMIMAILDSYTLFIPGQALPVGDMANYFAHTVSRSFVLAAQIAAPLLVVGLVFYLGLGLLARLMPQVQIFFIAIPVQTLLGLFVLSLTIPAMFFWFARALENLLENFMDLGAF